MMPAKVKGVGAVLGAFRKVRQRHEKGMERGLKRAGLWLQRESQKLVPVDTAALKNSANTRAEGSGFTTVVYVTYGTVYAVIVHEDLNAYHDIGQAKYLEQPAREGRPEMRSIVKEEMRK